MEPILSSEVVTDTSKQFQSMPLFQIQIGSWYCHNETGVFVKALLTGYLRTNNEAMQKIWVPSVTYESPFYVSTIPISEFMNDFHPANTKY